MQFLTKSRVGDNFPRFLSSKKYFYLQNEQGLRNEVDELEQKRDQNQHFDNLMNQYYLNVIL